MRGPTRIERLLPADFRMDDHTGHWVVLVDDRVVESGQDLSSCLARARAKHPRSEPLVVQIPVPGPRRAAEWTLF